MWMQIAFYVVTSILAYLLTPKPKVQQATATAPSPAAQEPPDAKTSGPVPVVFGTVWIVPNVIWYGDLSTSPIQECQSGGGGGKK